MNYDVFIQGKDIDLTVVDSLVVENSNWYKWFNDENITRDMQQHYYPNTKSIQFEFVKNCIEGRSDKLQVGIVHKADNELIGVISLSDIDNLNRRCELSGFIGEKKYQSLKYFLEGNKLLITHAFDQLNMNKIVGGSMTKEVSIFYTRLLNFEVEGIRKEEVYKNGHYYDVYLFGLLRKRYYEFKK